MENEELFDAAVEAMTDLYSDPSLSLEQAYEVLKEFQMEVVEHLNNLRLDLAAREG